MSMAVTSVKTPHGCDGLTRPICPRHSHDPLLACRCALLSRRTGYGCIHWRERFPIVAPVAGLLFRPHPEASPLA